MLIYDPERKVAYGRRGRIVVPPRWDYDGESRLVKFTEGAMRADEEGEWVKTEGEEIKFERVA